MNQAIAFRVAAAVGAAGVILGAFGAHGLKELLDRNQATAAWQTAVLYHLIHAVVLLMLASVSPWRKAPWCFLLAGVILFSGSLYILGLTGLRWLGAVTPFGGVCFIAGWIWLA